VLVFRDPRTGEEWASAAERERRAAEQRVRAAERGREAAELRASSADDRVRELEEWLWDLMAERTHPPAGE